MTRINSSYPVKDLYDQHLMAEYRELTMVPAALRRSLRTKTKAQILASIPSKFCLGSGHVRFWYNKLDYLKTRYAELQTELRNRGFNIDLSRPDNCDHFDTEFYTGYTATLEDLKLITERIDSKIAQKPNWYRKTPYQKI